MKKIILSFSMLAAAGAYAQNTGIGTTAPNATLEVKGNAGNTTTPDGVIPPQLTRAQLIAKTAYGANQKGAMVYVTDTSGTTNTATTKVDTAGFYYWDGSAWQKVAGNDWSLTGNAGTDPAVNFIGTTDDRSLSFKTSNNERWRITRSGRLVNQNFIAAAGGVLSSLFIGGAETGSWSTGNESAMSSFGNIGIGFGTAARIDTSAQLNTFIGYDSTNANIITGSRNTAYGAFTLPNLVSGSNNSALGTDTLARLTTGSNNTAVGQLALGNLTTGSNNTVIGTSSGSNISTSNNNIVIGYNANTSSASVSNQLSIGNSIYGLNINDGNTTNDLIGIQNPNPTQTLDVTGNTKTKGFYTAITTVSSDYTVLPNDYTIIISGGTNITLPSASTNVGRILIIRNATGSNLTITPYIRVSTADNNPVNYIYSRESVQLQSDGSNWWQIN